MNNEKILLKNANLIDVINEKILRNTDVYVENGIIKDIGKDLSYEAEVISLKDKFLLPGLINLHAHLFGSGKPSKNITGGPSQKLLLKFIKTKLGNVVLNKIVKNSLLTELYSGTTTLRSVGDFYFSDVKQRDAINSGKYVGPTLYCSGFAITAHGGHGDGTFARSAKSKAEYEALVENNIAHNVDWIKICSTGGVMDTNKIGGCGALKMSLEEVTWVTDLAHNKGFRVASHTEGSEGMMVDILGGVDTIEHGAELDEEVFKKDYSKYKKCALITTLSPAIPFDKLDKNITRCDDVQKANANIVSNGIIEASKYALSHNVVVGLGTDASCPYAYQHGMWRELAYFHKYVGVKSSFAIKTATIINARILGKDNEIGSIDIGKKFDAFVVDNDPFINLKTLSKPDMVFKNGIVIKKHPKKNDYIEKLLDELI